MGEIKIGDSTEGFEIAFANSISERLKRFTKASICGIVVNRLIRYSPEDDIGSDKQYRNQATLLWTLHVTTSICYFQDQLSCVEVGVAEMISPKVVKVRGSFRCWIDV